MFVENCPESPRIVENFAVIELVGNGKEAPGWLFSGAGTVDRRRLKGRQRRTLVRGWRFDGYSTSRSCPAEGTADTEGQRINTPLAGA